MIKKNLFIVAALIATSFTCNNRMITKEDCFGEREKGRVITDNIGKIVNMLDFYYIEVGDNSRFEPCTLPKEVQLEGATIKFSGQTYQVLPTERRAGTPIVITKIELVK